MVNARFAILASIPLPGNPPDDTLKPIVLPPTCTLHEFLSSTSGVSSCLMPRPGYLTDLAFRLFATCRYPISESEVGRAYMLSVLIGLGTIACCKA